MSASNRDALANLVSQVTITSLEAYKLQGYDIKVAQEAQRDPAEALAASLATQLYSRFYTNPTQVPRAVQTVEDPNLQQKFLAELVRANSSRWSWTPRWRVVGEEGAGQLTLESRHGRVVVPAALVDGPDEHGYGRLRTDKGSASVQRAWYWAYGEDNVSAERPRVVRVYWAVSAEGAVPLLRALTRAFNEQRVPFQFKTLQDPQQYTRSDSAVLYLPAYAWERAARILARVHALVERYLVDQTPLFTRRVARGMAVAEDPGEDAQSFGSHRSRLVADALVRAHQMDVPGEERVDAVVADLASRGYELERLHLNPGAPRDYDLPLLVAAQGGA